MNTSGKYILGIATFIAALFMTACDPTADASENTAVFVAGSVMGYSQTQQYISVSTDMAWTSEIVYTSPAGATDWCTLTPSSGTGGSNVLMKFGRNTLDEPRTLTIKFRFGSSVVSLDFTQNAIGTTQSEHSGWLELPAFAADNDTYYFSSHMLPSSGNSKRSFSVFYDAEYHIPMWVAYPLCNYYLASGNRTNAWGTYDPGIPQNVQTYLGSAYSGYQRGHMLPSASRNKTTADNVPTFYNTNMTPQLGSLNEYKWAGIEEQVRSWAKSCDTLYVVTGAVLKTAGGNENISYTYARGDSGKSVAIPNYYYKALLQYRKSSNSYQAIAIWMPHKAANGNITTDDILTIDQLEALTGIDFYTNLEKTVQDAVEGSYSLVFWQGIEKTTD